LLAVQLQLLESFLHPLPIGQLFLLCMDGHAGAGNGV
jgi:hypothetical protein